jgi:PIN domain nuclease of toxin-antitoxin system
VRVLADSQAALWFVADSDRLSNPARYALRAAVRADGIAVSVVTLVDLWLATQNTGATRVYLEHLARLKAVLRDPSFNFQLVPLTAAAAEHFEDVPRDQLRDPFDRFIVSTALADGLPLVSADRAIRALDGLDVVW